MSDTITVIGSITEPELRFTNGGVPFVKFRLASTSRRLDPATDKWSDGETNWYRISAFRGLAEHAASSLHKGERVIVTGRLHVREWDTGAKQGVTAEIEADAIGPDLKWGTTTFQRTGSASGASPGESISSTTEWATALPGSTAAAQWSPPLDSGATASAEREAVPMVRDSPEAAGETPF